ncbi:MAG: hypothetical protein ACT4QC_15630 [Planctomycetaceae bacterium]
MNCTEFEIQLFEQLNRTNSRVPASLDEHAAECPVCREKAAALPLLKASIEAWRSEVPEVDLAPEVLAACLPRLEANSNRPQPRPLAALSPEPANRLPSRPLALVSPSPANALRGPRGALLSAVGALAACVAVLWLVPPFGGPHSPEAPAVRPVATTRPARARAPESPRPAVGGPIAGLDGLALLVAPTMNLPGATFDGASGLVQGLQDRIEPIRQGLDGAFDFLWVVSEPPENSRT